MELFVSLYSPSPLNWPIKNKTFDLAWLSGTWHKYIWHFRLFLIFDQPLVKHYQSLMTDTRVNYNCNFNGVKFYFSQKLILNWNKNWKHLFCCNILCHWYFINGRYSIKVRGFAFHTFILISFLDKSRSVVSLFHQQ